MGRRVGRFLVIIPALVAVAFVLLLATCSNAFDIFEAIKTELKIANDLYLEIIEPSISPSPTDPDPVSQLERIEIQFDRSINEATIDQSSVVFDPAPVPGDLTGTVMKDWNYIYYACCFRRYNLEKI